MIGKVKEQERKFCTQNLFTICLRFMLSHVTLFMHGVTGKPAVESLQLSANSA